MTIPVFPPKRNRDLLTWSASFRQKIAASPGAYGLTAQQATDFAALHEAFAEAMQLATNPATNSKANIIRKNESMQELLHGQGGAWQLVRIVQASPGTTNEMRGSLGLRLLDVAPSPIARPTEPPNLFVESRSGREVRLRLRDRAAPDSRGKPEGVLGATVLCAIGEQAPADRMAWSFLMNTSKALFTVTIPASVPAGSRIWLTAFWFNGRMQTSPAATPKATMVNDALALAA